MRNPVRKKITMSIIEIEDRPAGASFYVTGGTLPFDAASYVPRQADHDLLAGLSAGEFCYVLNTRQMGKSSLMIRTANHLRLQGDTVAVLDLTAVGQNLSPAQWYNGLLMSLGEQLHLEDLLEDFWHDNPNLSPLQRFMTALGRVVLPQTPQRLTVFVDEIDAVRSLPFSADEFFAGIRECYNRRQTDPAYAKLTFCLLGVATPTDLIVDTRLSPFNIGRRILLTDFTPAEAAPLAQGLSGGARVLDRALYWTNGHPYVTQRLCRAIAEEPNVVTPSAVDTICERLFLSKQAQETDDNLAFVRNRLLRSEVDLAALLDLYRQVRSGRRVKDDETSPLVPVLRLSGVVSVRDGFLRVRNRVYDRVFDDEWVTAHVPDAEKRRQAAAYRRGVLRTAGLSSAVVLLMALLSGWALHASRVAQANALTAKKSLAATQNALKAEKAAEQFATSEEKKAQNLLQVADLQFAGQTFDSETGTAALANSLLDASRTIPPGQRGTERFEWRYQWGLTHDSAAIVESHATGAFPGPLVAVTPQGVLTALDGQFHLHRVLLGRGQAFWQEDGVQSGTSSQALQARPVYSLSPDGTLVGSGTSDGQIVVQDTAGLRRIASWRQEGTGGLVSLNFLQHNRVLRGYFGNGDDSVTDWDARTGQTLHHWTKEMIPQISRENGGSIWSPDGRSAALLINDQQTPQIQILDLTRIGVGGYAPITVGLAKFYLSAAFSPDGKTLACGGYSGQVLLLDATSGRQKQTLQALGLGTDVDTLAFSADGNTLAAGGQDGLIRLWSLQQSSAVLRGSFKGHTNGIAQLQFSADGRWLASSDSGGTARAWRLSGLRDPLLNTGHGTYSESLVFSPDGRWLVSSVDTGQAELWDTQTWQKQQLPKCSDYGAFRGGTQRISAFAFSPDGRTVVTSGEVDSDPASAAKSRTIFIQFWDRKTERAGPRWETMLDDTQEGTSQMSGGLHVLAFSPDGRTLAGGFGQVYEAPQEAPQGDRMAALWDVSTGRLRRTLTGFRQGITALSYSPDGRSLAAGCMDQTVRCFDTRTWTPTRTFAAQDYVTSIAYSPDGRTLAIGDWSGLIRLTDTRTWAVQSLIGHSDTLRGLSFSQDSLTLASASEDGTVKLWDAVTGRETRTLSVNGQRLYRVVFSPNGNLLASGDSEGRVHLWHAAPTVQIAAWEKQEGDEQSLHATSAAVTSAAQSGWRTPNREPRAPSSAPGTGR